MNRAIIAAVAATVMLATPVFAQSAKFAATYDDTTFPLAVVSVIDSDSQPNDCNSNDGLTMATIKVPQDKELLVGLSAEVLLVTDTSIKGKAGGTARALAYSGGGVQIGACPVEGGDCVTAERSLVPLSGSRRIDTRHTTG